MAVSDGSGTSTRPRSPGSSIRVDPTASATTPRKTHRQPTPSATSPATLGPIIEGTTQAAANAPKMAGWSTGA